MKKVVWTLGVLALTAGLAAAQEKAAPKKAAGEHSAADKAIIANEEKVNDAFIKGDAATFKSLVAADAWAVDASGFSDMAAIDKMMADAKITESHMSGAKVLWADPSTAIITYKWTGKGTFMGQPVKPAYVGSVWTKKGDKWVAVYHQETEAAPPPKPAPKKK